MTSPSSIAGWFDTVPTTVPLSMTSHSSKVGRDLRLDRDKKHLEGVCVEFVASATEVGLFLYTWKWLKNKKQLLNANSNTITVSEF
jgi:hypothetical protein